MEINSGLADSESRRNNRCRAHWVKQSNPRVRRADILSAPRAALLGILFAIFGFGGASTPAADSIATVELPGFARTITADADGNIAAAMALGGTALLKFEADTLSVVTSFPEIPSLHVAPLGAGRFLVAERFGALVLIEPNTEGVPVETARWPIEANPTFVALQDDAMFVAAGGAGLYRYEWHGGKSAPQLRARYPYVDFSKEIAFGAPGFLYLADNLETGLQIIAYPDPLRLRQTTALRGDFVDSVTARGDIVVAARRRTGAYIYQASADNKLSDVGLVQTRSDGGDRTTTVMQVRLSPADMLLICEGPGGGRLKQLRRSAGGTVVMEPGERLLNPGNDGIVSGHFLSADRLVTSGGTGIIQLWKLDSSSR